LLLEKALRALHETTGIGTKAVAHEPRLPDGRRADARITFKAPLPTYLAEIKGEMTPARLGPVLAQLRGLPPPCVLVTRYVTPPLAERLHAEDIQFVDTAGNAYLHQQKPYYHIFITGRKQQVPAPAERPIKAFRAAGLRVIFLLLCLPDAVNATYREIANLAGVALGTVAQTMAELKRIGLLRETRTGRTLQERRKCIDTWVDAYPRELRPRLKPRRFRVDNPDWWRKKNLEPLDIWLGGEAGAAILTKYLRPEIVTIYGDRHFAALARDIRPVRDEHGNLEVLEKFWRFDPVQTTPGHRLVPPLLIYADLVATADARNLETAEMIREQYLG
jgi:hypothetical protein